MYYTIDWDALAALEPAERMAELARIGAEVRRVTAAARVRTVHRAVAAHRGQQRDAAAELGLSPQRIHQITREEPTMVTATPVQEPAALHHRYPGQNEPQGAYVALDTEGARMWACWDAEIGNAVPAEVHHGIVRRYPIPALTSTAANAAMEDIRPLAERVVADSERVWDGSNAVARLGDDARAAEEEIRRRLGSDAEIGEGPWDESDLVTVWDSDGAILGGGHEEAEYGITAETTDERLEQIAEEIRGELAEVSPSGEVVLDGEVLDYLHEARDEAREGGE